MHAHRARVTHTPDEVRTLTYVRLDALMPALRNAKMHDLGAIQASMQRFGFTQPPFVDERTQLLVAGHGRQEALIGLKQLGHGPPRGILIDDDGEWLVPLVRGWASRDDAEAEAYNLADNLLNEAGGWFRKTLAEMMESVATADAALLDTMAWTAEDMDELLASVNINSLSGDDDGITILPDALDPKAGEQTIDVPGRPGDENPDRPLDGDDDEGTSADLPTTTCPACAHTWVRPEDELTVLGSTEPVSIGDILRNGSGLLLPGSDD